MTAQDALSLGILVAIGIIFYIHHVGLARVQADVDKIKAQATTAVTKAETSVVDHVGILETALKGATAVVAAAQPAPPPAAPPPA